MALPAGQTNVALSLVEIAVLRTALDVAVRQERHASDAFLRHVRALDAKLDQAELRAERSLSE